MRRLLFVFPFLLLLISAGPKPVTEPSGYAIKVRVAGLKDTVCFLAHYYGDKQYIDDTAQVDAKGNFTFLGKKALPGGIYLIVLPGKRYFEIILDEQHFTVETDSKDYVTAMKIKGSKENELFYQYLRFINNKGILADSLQKIMEASKENDKLAYEQSKKKLEATNQEVLVYRTDFALKNPQTFTAKLFKSMDEPQIPEAPLLPNGKKDSTFAYKYYKQHFWDNIDLKDDRIIRSPIFHGKLEKYMKNMVLQVPDSINKEADYIIEKCVNSKELYKYCIWYITNTYETSQIMGMDAVFVHMAEKYYLSGKAYWVDKSVQDKIRDRVKILKPLLLGKIAPNLDMQDSLAKSHEILKMKGKYTFVYFWDPGCGHCQKVTPKLHEWYLANKSKFDVSVYAANIERNETEWKSFIKKHQLTWTNVYDPKHYISFRDTYDIYSTPVLYILDENKRILAKRLGVEQLDEFFSKYKP